MSYVVCLLSTVFRSIVGEQVGIAVGRQRKPAYAQILHRIGNLDASFAKKSFDAVVDVALDLRMAARLARPHKQTQVE